MAVDNSLKENFCNKTPKNLCKICQNRSSEVIETIHFKNIRAAAPNPAGEGEGGSQRPPDSQLDFWYVSTLTRWLPYDGYIRHQSDHLSGRMTDISAMGEWQVVGVGGTRPLGKGSRGTIFVWSSKLSLLFPELCPFRRVFFFFFCFPHFWKIWRQKFKLWGFWFRRWLGELFENSAPSPGIFLLTPTTTIIKGEVRTINDRNICERRSCMKNNGKSPTFKFVSGEERCPTEVQRVSRGWRLPGATHSSADLTWIRKWLEIQAPELPELESVELELGCCCSDLDKQVSDEIRWTRKRQLEIPFRL